jgi:hypothetical protein
MNIKGAPIDALDSKAIVPIRKGEYGDHTEGTFRSRDRSSTFNHIDWVVGNVIQSYGLVGCQM